jgi:predicted O-methyltransferase YrrM
MTLYQYARRAVYPIVEIGSWMGRSTLFLAYGAWKGYRQKIYAIDTWLGSEEHCGMPELVSIEEKFDHTLSTCGFPHEIVKIKGHSQEIELSRIPKKIGLLFIDGSHDYESVKADYLRYSPLIAHDGILAFHDVAAYAPGVQQFVENEIPLHQWEKQVHAGSLAVFRRLA